MFNHSGYVERCEAEGSPSNIFRCPGTQIEHIIVDAMHAADLGAFCDAMGYLFWMEINYSPYHRTHTKGIA